MPHHDAAALVLAAGKGTRMHSDKPKVLHTLLNEPMLGYVFAALEPLFGPAVLTVVGFGADQVRRAYPGREATFVTQTEQLGTGHALQTALGALRKLGRTHCLVVNGDTPLLESDAVERFLAESAGADVAFATITPGPSAGSSATRTTGSRPSWRPRISTRRSTATPGRSTRACIFCAWRR